MTLKMEVISENEGLKGSECAACLNLEVVILPALYLYHKFDIDRFHVSFSKNCTLSVVTTIDEKTLTFCNDTSEWKTFETLVVEH